MTHRDDYDVLVIGAGHNGLTAALYLTAAGLKVCVLERRAEFGGGLSTEEATLPGYYHNLHSNFHASVPWIPPLRDFDLARRGVHYYHPQANIGMPLSDGRALVLYHDDARSAAEIARFSKKDAETYVMFRRELRVRQELMLSLAYTPAPRTVERRAAAADELVKVFGQDVFWMSPLDFVRTRFETPALSALMLFHVSIGGWDIRQMAMVPIALAFLAFLTDWKLCRGGSHQLAHALGGELLGRGGELLEHAHVDKILVDGKGAATGVRLRGGRELRARRAVISTVDMDQTLLRMLEPGTFDETFRGRIERIQYGPADVLFGGHLALAEAPRYTASKFNPDLQQVFNLNLGYERPEDLVEHYEELDRQELPKVPRLNASNNTLFDPTQAPPGKHTALIWQFAPYAPGGDATAWDRLKDEYLRRCVETWRRYAPNLTDDVVLGGYGYTPLDVERKLVNMRRGGFHFGAMIPAQMGELRPLPELAGCKTPVAGLYLGGACMHVHGGITASPGYNCARVVLEDLGLADKMPPLDRPWRAEPA